MPQQRLPLLFPGPASAGQENDSGMGLPAPADVEAAGFHVGAFLCGGLWAVAHELSYVAAGDLVLLLTVAVSLAQVLRLEAGPQADPTPLVAAALLGAAWLLLRVMMGTRGYAWAWQSRRFASKEVFWQVQRAWVWGGLIALVLLVGIVAWPSNWGALAKLASQYGWPKPLP